MADAHCRLCNCTAHDDAQPGCWLVRGDEFGLRWVRVDCWDALADEGTYEAHQDDDYGCDCETCRRHLARAAKERDGEQLSTSGEWPVIGEGAGELGW